MKVLLLGILPGHVAQRRVSAVRVLASGLLD